jgi:hypothetical protein
MLKAFYRIRELIRRLLRKSERSLLPQLAACESHTDAVRLTIESLEGTDLGRALQGLLGPLPDSPATQLAPEDAAIFMMLGERFKRCEYNEMALLVALINAWFLASFGLGLTAHGTIKSEAKTQ